MTSAGRAKQLAELSGMVLGTTPLPAGTVTIWPGLKIDGADLAYELVPVGDVQPHDATADGLLEAFMNIRGPDDVLRFAGRFGVLWLCERHGLPPGPMERGGMVRSPHGSGCGLRGYPQPREPVSQWLAFAERARSIVELAGHLHGGGTVKPAERVAAWHELYDGVQQRVRPEHVDKLAHALAKNRSMAIHFLGDYVNYWLMLGGARPAVIWPPGWHGEPEKGASLELRAGGTFGVMAIQLATAVAKAQDIYICDGCKNSYLRTERPPRTERNYCLTCKDSGIDERDRKRRQRRLAGKRRSHGKKSTR